MEGVSSAQAANGGSSGVPARLPPQAAQFSTQNIQSPGSTHLCVSPKSGGHSRLRAVRTKFRLQAIREGGVPANQGVMILPQSWPSGVYAGPLGTPPCCNCPGICQGPRDAMRSSRPAGYGGHPPTVTLHTTVQAAAQKKVSTQPPQPIRCQAAGNMKPRISVPKNTRVITAPHISM